MEKWRSSRSKEKKWKRSRAIRVERTSVLFSLHIFFCFHSFVLEIVALVECNKHNAKTIKLTAINLKILHKQYSNPFAIEKDFNRIRNGESNCVPRHRFNISVSMQNRCVATRSNHSNRSRAQFNAKHETRRPRRRQRFRFCFRFGFFWGKMQMFDLRLLRDECERIRNELIKRKIEDARRFDANFRVRKNKMNFQWLREPIDFVNESRRFIHPWDYSLMRAATITSDYSK